MRLTTVLLPIICIVPLAAHDGDKLNEIIARGVLRVSVKNEGSLDRSEHNDPAHFQKRGFELDLARAIAKRILGDESKIEFKMLRRRQRLAAVADGTVDIGISMFAVNEENQAQVAFSEPYYEGGQAVMQKSQSTVHAISDLNGMKIVALDEKMNDPGGELQRLAAKQGVHVDIMRVPTFKEGIDALEANQVDGMVSEIANLDAYIADGHPNLKHSGLLSHKHYAVAIRKNDTDLLVLINDVIGQLKKSGHLNAMLEKWGLVQK